MGAYAGGHVSKLTLRPEKGQLNLEEKKKLFDAMYMSLIQVIAILLWEIFLIIYSARYV